MAWQSGGGGGYPGVTSDGANGIRVAGSVTRGGGTVPSAPAGISAGTRLAVTDDQFSIENNVDEVSTQQVTDVTVDQGGGTCYTALRGGDISSHDYGLPMVWYQDFTASAQPVLRLNKGGVVTLEIGAIKSITGALSTVTDAAAKAVLTSIIATLTGIKVATNNTT